MLLQGIHDKAQGWLAWLIVILISVPFALWGIHEYFGGGGRITVAKVNGQDIDKYHFDNQVSNQIQRLRSFGGDIDVSSLEKEIKQTTLDRMIEEELIFQTAMANQLRIGNAMLEARIHSIPAFQTEGQFSKTLYEQLVRQQYPSSADFEQGMRRDLLLAQLQQGVSNSAVVSPAAQANYAELDKQQRLVSYVLIKADKFKASVTISEEAIQKHYEEHQKDYFTPEKVSIDYVVLDKSKLAQTAEISEEILKQRYAQQNKQYTTAAQWQASHILMLNDAKDKEAKQKAEAVLKRAKAGEDFAALAKEFSKDPGSAAQGGDLGFFSSGDMVAPFEEAVKTMQVGDISDLVESRFGFHIIKLTAIKAEQVKPFAEVREDLLKQVQNEEVQTKFDALVEEFSNLAFEQPDSLQALVDRLSLVKESTELFTREGEATGLLANKKLVQTAFSTSVLQDGNNSEVLTLDDGRLLVMRVKQHEKPAVQALDTVKEKIKETLQVEKSKTQAIELGEKLLATIREKGDWQSLLSPQELVWEKAVWVTRNGNEISTTELRNAAFKMGKPEPEQALYQGVKLANGDYAVLAVFNVKAPATLEKNQAQLAQQQGNLGQSEYQAFLSSLKEQADIKIYSSHL